MMLRRFLRHFGAALAVLSGSLAHAQCPAEWSDRFPSAELYSSIQNNSVRVKASAVYDDGSGPALYVAGNFEFAGGIPAKCIARWDGFQWSNPFPPITENPTPLIYAMAVLDGPAGPELIVAGRFNSIAGVPGRSILRWNGAQWSHMGESFNDDVHALTIFDDHSGAGPRLYAGGTFSASGSVSLNRVARWNGTQWERLTFNDAIAGTVYALDGSNSPAGSFLYAGGSFSSQVGTSSNILRFNGTSWMTMAGGISGNVYAIQAVDDGPLAGVYAGGNFSQVGGTGNPVVAARNIVKWNGGAWSALGAGAGSNVRVISHATVADDSSLYVGGDFTSAAGLTGSGGIVRWDGSAWHTLGPGVTSFTGGGGVHAITQLPKSLGGRLAVTGGFRGEDVSVAHLATWDGAAWHRPGNAPSVNRAYEPSDRFNAAIHAMAVHDDGNGRALFVAGGFSGFGDTVAPLIGKWTGHEWLPLVPLEQVPGCAACFEQFLSLLPTTSDFAGGSALYISGRFRGYDFMPFGDSIVRWDGAQFTPLGTGLQGDDGFYGAGNAMTFFDDPSGRSLVVVGRFARAGGVPVANVARWNGSLWTAMGEGFNNSAHAIAVFDDGNGPRLFAAGQFTASGATPLNAVAVWNGSQWNDAGIGLSDPYQSPLVVGELVVHDDGRGNGPALFAAGRFFNAGGMPANGLARWNGKQWTAVAHNPDFYVGDDSAMTSFDDGRGDEPVLYVSGDSTTGSTLARWDGAGFSLISPSPNTSSTYAIAGINALVPFHVPGDHAASLFAGGRFGQVGGVASHRFAQLLPCPRCIADFDHSGAVNSSDYFAFLAAFFSGGPAADINDDDVVNSTDYFDFLHLFFDGCP